MITVLRRAAVVIILAVSATGCASEKERHDRLIAAGDRFFAEKKFAEANLEYRRALQIDPLSAVAYAKVGDASMAADDPRNALAAYSRAADLAPDDIRSNLIAGNLMLVAKRFQDAKTRARNVLVKDPKNVAGLVLLGNSLAGLQSMDEAVDVAKRAAALDPSRAGLLGNLGVYELIRGNTEDAERTFKRAIDAAPDTISGYLALGNLYQSLGRLDEAIEVLNRALKLDPKDPGVNATMALVMVQGGRPLDAEPYLKLAANAVKSTEASLGLADYYVSVGRTGEALGILDKLAGTPDGFAAARIRAALVDYALGNREQAHARLKEVLAKDPRNPTALATEGRMLLAENRFDDAMKLVDSAINADPRSAQAHFVLGKIQQLKGATEAARKAFLEALNLDATRSDAAIELAKIHRMRQEPEAAIRYAETAVRNDSSSLDAHLTLMRALSMRPEDDSKADAEMKTLSSRFPNSPEVAALRGVLALRRGRVDEARRSFEAALAQEPDNVDALSGLAAIDSQAGRPRAARERVEQRVKNSKQPSAELLLLAAKTCVTTNDPDCAETYLRRLVQNDPTNLETYNLLGRFYLVRGKTQEARKEFEAIVAREPKAAGAHTMLGLLYQGEGDIERARKSFEAAVTVDAKAAAAANNLAWIYANSDGGDLDAALNYAQTARALMPGSTEAADTLAFVYYKKNMGSFAIPLLEQALTVDPDNPSFHYHLGLVFAQAGEDSKARRSLESALKLNPTFKGADHARKVISTLIY